MVRADGLMVRITVAGISHRDGDLEAMMFQLYGDDDRLSFG